MSTEPSPVNPDGEDPEHPAPSHDERPARRRRQATAVAIAAGVLLAGGGAYWASAATGGGKDGGDSAAKPPPLALDDLAAKTGSAGSGGTGGSGGDGSGRSGVAPGEPNGHSPLKVTGDLPGGPDSAAVWHPRHTVSRGSVAALAKALGVPGAPKKTRNEWTVGGGATGGDGKADGPGLTVHRGGALAGDWSYSRDRSAGDPHCVPSLPKSPGGPTRSGTGSIAMACPGNDGQGADDDEHGKPVSEQKAEDAVRPAEKALRLGGASVDAGGAMGSNRMVGVTPRVDGKPTRGWESTFVVGADGKPKQAHGRIGALRKGAAYPVQSASRTLEQFRAGQAPGATAPNSTGGAERSAPHPMKQGEQEKQPSTRGPDTMSVAEGGGRSAAPAGTGKPLRVTGATFGLSTHVTHGHPVLVPSWFYTVKLPRSGQTLQMDRPAVRSDLLKARGGASASHSGGDGSSAPQGKHGDKSGKDGKHGKGKSDEGSGIGVPHQGHSGKAPLQAVNAYKAHGRTLKLTFWGGVCGGYRASADESAKTVKVTVRPKGSGAKKMCVKMAKRKTVTVHLDKPLGDRKVVDVQDGKRLPAAK